MKTIRVVYGTTANKFWGVCGLIMHSAICSASQKTMPCEGIVRSKLTAMSKVVNVQSEGKSITLMARLNDARLTKFLSHSRNVKIKQSHLTGFFTLNPSHAQNVVVGIAGLLKGRLASFGISLSKDNVISPNFRFSLSMKRKKLCLSGMLKRMTPRGQESSKDLDVNSNVEKIFESDEVIDTEQRRVKSTISSPKKDAEEEINEDRKASSLSDLGYSYLNEDHHEFVNFVDSYSEMNLDDLYSRIKNPDDVLRAATVRTYEFIKNKMKIGDNEEAFDEREDIESSLKRNLEIFDTESCARALKNLCQQRKEIAKNCTIFHEYRTSIDNLSNLIEQECSIHQMYTKRVKRECLLWSNNLKTTHKKFISKINPFIIELNEGFIILRDFIENELIPSYQQKYSHFEISLFNMQVSIIEKIFLSQFQNRLQISWQPFQEKIKALENNSYLSKQMYELSDQLLTLENPKNTPLLEDQLLRYLRVLTAIVDTHSKLIDIYSNQEKMEDLNHSLFMQNLIDSMIYCNFLNRIESFCRVSADSIRIGNAMVLNTVLDLANKYRDKATKDHDELLNYVKAGKELAILVQNAKEVYQTCLIEPLTPLAPPPWEIFERISPIVNFSTIEGIKIDHLNSREELSSRLDTKESGGSKNFENRQTENKTKYTEESDKNVDYLNKDTRELNKSLVLPLKKGDISLKKPESILKEVGEEADKIVDLRWSITPSLFKFTDGVVNSEKKMRTVSEFFDKADRILPLQNVEQSVLENDKIFCENQTMTENVGSTLINEINKFRGLNEITEKNIIAYSSIFDEREKILTSRILPLLTELKDKYVRAQHLIEDHLIPSYLNTFASYHSTVSNTQTSIIENFFSSQFQTRLKPFFQQHNENMKQLEKKEQLSKEICTFSDKFLILEDLQNAPSLREDQLPGYLKIIRSIVATYFNMKNLDPQKNSLLRENSNKNARDFLILNIFMEKIDAFCQVASDSISLGNANTLICITETLKEYKDRVLEAHAALSDSLSKEECYEKNEQFWMEWYEAMVLKSPTATLAPPWEISKRMSPERQPHLTEREVNVEDDSEIVNSAIIEGIKIDHLNSREELSSRLDTKESGGSENFENKQTENETKYTEESHKSADCLNKNTRELNKSCNEIEGSQNIMMQMSKDYCSKIKNPNTIIKTLPKTLVAKIGQDNAEIYTLKDEDAAAIEVLGQKKEIMAKLFNENNESLILKNFKQALSNSNENRRNSEKNKTRIDNIRSSMRDAIEDYEKINIQRKHVKSMRSQRLNELRLMITSQMIPFFQNLREDFIELKDFIENVLISEYKQDYSDFSLDAFYMPSHPRNLHKSFIDSFFSSEVNKRLKPFLQQSQEEIKRLENKLEFSKEMRALFDNLLKLENLENSLELERQLSGYVEIIENILKIYLEDQKQCLVANSPSDLFFLSNFRERIDAFCNMAADCIFAGSAAALNEISKMFLKEQKATLAKEQHIQALSLEKEKQIISWQEIVAYFCAIDTKLELAPPSWEQQ